MNGIPIGCVLCFATQKIPDGFLPCDGRELSKIGYSELYAMIGDTWGETTSTFFLPDLRGQFVRGWDDGDGVDPDSGAEQIRHFGSEQEDTIQGHGHNVHIEDGLTESIMHYETKTVKRDSGDNAVSVRSIVTPIEHETRSKQLKAHTGLFSVLGRFATGIFNMSNVKHSHKMPNISVKDAISSTYQRIRVSTETRPKNIALIYCIKVK